MAELWDDERLTVIGLFAEAFAGLAGQVREQLSEHGLADVEFEVLIRLARSPGNLLRMSDLSAQTSLTTSGTTRVVDRLGVAGLVCRQSCATDRRITYAVLTDAGRARVLAALPDHLELIDQSLIGPLEPAQLEAFVGALRVLRDALSPGATAGADRASGRSVLAG